MKGKGAEKKEKNKKLFLAETKSITTIIRKISIVKINQLSLPYLWVITSIDEGELIDVVAVLVSWLALQFPGETFGSPFLYCLLFIGAPGHSPQHSDTISLVLPKGEIYNFCRSFPVQGNREGSRNCLN